MTGSLTAAYWQAQTAATWDRSLICKERTGILLRPKTAPSCPRRYPLFVVRAERVEASEKIGQNEAGATVDARDGCGTPKGTPRGRAKVIVRLHSVQAGETLHGIARAYNVPTEAIKLLNKKNSDWVYVDELLYLPAPPYSEVTFLNQIQDTEPTDDVAVIQLSPRAKLMLRKISSDPCSPGSVRRESEPVTAAAPPICPNSPPGEASQRAETTKGLFASVQAATSLSGWYSDSAVPLGPGVTFGRGTMALGLGLILVGSASMLRSFLKKNFSRLQGKNQEFRTSPAARTARRFLEEVKRGGAADVRPTGGGKLRFSLGDEMVVRSKHRGRELVVNLRQKDVETVGLGRLHVAIETAQEEETWEEGQFVVEPDERGVTKRDHFLDDIERIGAGTGLAESPARRKTPLSGDEWLHTEIEVEGKRPAHVQRGCTEGEGLVPINPVALVRHRAAASLPYSLTADELFGLDELDMSEAHLFDCWSVGMARQANRRAASPLTNDEAGI